MSHDLPQTIETEVELDDVLTRPSLALVGFIRNVSSPLLVLGAGGKMGPSLAVLAKRAAESANHSLDVIAVSRFSNPANRKWLESKGVKTESVDLLDSKALARLPSCRNLIYLVGQKFGTAQNPASTWVMNTVVPAYVAERYSEARMVVLSTANVYPFTEPGRGGSLESDPLGASGEYANAAIGRERVFEFYSRRDSISVAILRLQYAVELRYGVLVDIASKVYAGEPVTLSNGYFNCIWQGDANEMILRSLPLAASPLVARNLCGPKILSVRSIALRFGELFNKTPRFNRQEEPTSLVSNSARLCAELGMPGISVETMLGWIAHWVRRGGVNLGRPTHFETRDGNY
jgi:nucleoside-diphosphate-sugar epimerase